MVLILEVPFAAIAFVLSLVSLKTIRAIKHLDVGKSFWIPVMLSGTFFLAGSVLAILNDVGFSFIPYTIEIVAVSQLIALCTLVSGVYTYSKKVTKNLAENFTLPTNVETVEPENEKVEISALDPERARARAKERTLAKDVECKHTFGYLQTLPRGTTIPDECLNCHQIIECKHTYLKKAVCKSTEPALKTATDISISDADLEAVNEH